MSMSGFSPHSTKDGCLPPREVAKAFALHTVLLDMAAEQAVQPHELVGQRIDDYISEQVTLKGGGHPSRRAAWQLIKKCEDPTWFPGKEPDNVGRRP